jgi:capsular polysaccharide biosynthesis protein
MDLLAIARKIWRHKLFALPVIVLTIAGAVYTVAVKKPLYEATSSYLLISPPPAPTADQIARNPALGSIRADNPYTRFSDQSVVIEVLARTMNSESARHSLVRAGADPGYMVSSAVRFGASSPIVQISGTGSTPEAAIGTAKVVGNAVVGELDRMQKVQDVDADYRITTLQVEFPTGAQLKASGQLRMLVGVLGLGIVVLFIVISVTEALETLARERRAVQAWTPDELALFGLDPDLDATSRANGRGGEHVPREEQHGPSR